MNRIRLKQSALVCLAALACATAVAETRPNLIFILADDLRWNMLGCEGNDIIQTPNLDQLAMQGVRFRNCFATTSICCVSRASILTGQYERRHGIPNFSKGLSPAQWSQTYPAMLRQAGYRTGFVGKFGVGGRKAIEAKSAEFDFWRGVPGQGGRFFIEPNDPTHTHATARFGNQALEFLEDCTTNQPFCLSISFNAPHARDGEAREFQPDLRDEKLYVTNVIPHSPTANREFFEKLQSFVQKSEGHNRWTNRFSTDEIFQRTMRDYYRLITGIDREVGRVRDELARRHLDENTVIIFTSDNGWFAGDRKLADKWLMYEESIRLPLIIYDPRFAVANRGKVVDAMTLNLDMAQTMLDFSHVPAPREMQGSSLFPLLTNSAPKDWRTDFFYEHHYAPEIIPPSEGVRTERWSYIHWLPPNPEVEELYDLSRDSLEGNNVAADPNYAGTLAELRTRWKKYQSELK